MIIAVDGYEANVFHRVGIGRYAYEILRYMYKEIESVKRRRKQEARVEPDIKFRIYLPDAPLPDMPEETRWWEYRIGKPKKFWTFIGLPLALATDNPKPDVVFSPTHYIPRFTTVKRVMSIMDTSFLRYPDMFRSRDLHQLTHWTRYSVEHAAAILTISHHSKNAIIDAYQIPSDRVTVTYLGVSMVNGNGLLKTALLQKYNIHKHFILSVGTLQPRKNYIKLIEAFSQFLSRNKQPFGDIDLVIIGKRGWLYDDILAAPSKFNIQERVKFLDFVEDHDLPAFYEHALCFVLPSLYEGFGLPVAEAMAYGCPVVVSNISSLPEIAGKAGIYVDPDSVDSITQGLLTAVRERNLMQGKLRIKRGLEQIKQFTWENAAKKTLEVLENVAVGEPA